VRIAMVSEHASPLATLGSEDAGGQNVHVAALATELAGMGHEVTVYTRREDPGQTGPVLFGLGVRVDDVPAGPPRPVPKDQLMRHMGAFARWLAARWRDDPPDLVHAHFWMSGYAAIRAAGPLAIPVVQTFHALGSAGSAAVPGRGGLQRHDAERLVPRVADQEIGRPQQARDLIVGDPAGENDPVGNVSLACAFAEPAYLRVGIKARAIRAARDHESCARYLAHGGNDSIDAFAWH
jgi:Glycosyltransferase Family 4